jgi:hypothetical protein
MSWLITRQGKDKCSKVVSPNPDRVALYKRIYDLLKTDDSIVFEVSRNYDIKVGKTNFLVLCHYPRTKIPYTGGSKKICYTFEANWIVDKKIPPGIERILEVKDFQEYEFVKMGLPISLEDNVKLLSECAMFVGVDNGICHVARSVGCPSFLIEHLHPMKNGFPYEYCKYTHCYGVDDTINKMMKHLGDMNGQRNN